MALIFVGPGRVMSIGGGLLALRKPVFGSTAGGLGASSPGQDLTEISGLAGWWDASDLGSMRGLDGSASVGWREQCSQIVSRSSSALPIESYRYIVDGRLAAPFPRIAGLLGGAGQLNQGTGLLRPALDPDQGFKLQESSFGSAHEWTWYLVWSRPNRRQGSFRDADPTVLLRAGNTVVLQAGGQSGQSNLTLFPNGAAVPLSSELARRHTHSIILRHSPINGLDVWLDDTLVVQGINNACPAVPQGPILFLHDGTFMGGAQCWFHEAAFWTRRLPDTEIARMHTHSGRWHRGARKGVALLFNGQSNAVNYSLNDGAAELLAQGVAWHLGAIAWNVLATTGSPNAYTMQSGHGLYQVQSGSYPGNFLNDPMNGMPPSGWSLGSDGTAVQNAIQALLAEDRDDISAIVWPWNETDSLRGTGELSTFVAAATRFLDLERGMVGKAAGQLPLIWWSAIPYGTAAGSAMHRNAVHLLSNTSGLNVVVGNPQTSDSNERGASWDELSGISTGGDAAHRDGDDNRRFARLAAPIVARAILASGGADSINQIPDTLPVVGGPRIIHAYRQNATSIVITVQHDNGSDLVIPRQAVNGKGFAVTDGGVTAGQGIVVHAVACERLSSTQLRITLAQPLQNASALCRLHYPYGGEAIGRGNAVTDNAAARPAPDGWDVSVDLGSAWRLDYPLASTMVPVELSDTPHA